MGRIKEILIILNLLFLVSILLFFVFYGFPLLYNEVIYPSHLSVQHACGEIDDNQLKRRGYEVGGYFQYDKLNESENKIKIFVPPRYNNWQLLNMHKNTRSYRVTEKHESIHRWQYSVGILGGCDNQWLSYLNEFQAYFFSEFFVV